MNLGSLTIDEFLARLGSSEPVPGGGSLTAVMGAQAAAMLAMCCNLTISRPRYADVAAEVGEILASALASQQQLMQLANQDVQAYLSVRDAHRLPRETDAERAIRTAAIEHAMHAATDVPVATSEAARAVLRLALRAARSTNVSALGDVSVAAYLAIAAARGAGEQARLNISDLSDQGYATTMRARIDGALDGAEAEGDAATATVRERWAKR